MQYGYYPPGNYPGFYIIDLSDFIIMKREDHFLNKIKYKFPVHELITIVLSFNHYVGDRDAIWFELERRYGDDLSSLDMNVFEIGVDAFTEDLDQFIRQKIPPYFDSGSYVIEDWVGGNAILLKYDQEAEQFRDSWESQHCQPHVFGRARYTRVIRGLYRGFIQGIA